MRTKYILFAFLSCLLLNAAAASENALLLTISGIAYLYCLYKIATLSGESGWLASFGILNMLGLIILLIIVRPGNKIDPSR